MRRALSPLPFRSVRLRDELDFPDNVLVVSFTDYETCMQRSADLIINVSVGERGGMVLAPEIVHCGSEARTEYRLALQ